MKFKIYQNSILATVVSVIGSVLTVGGVLMLLATEYLLGVVLLAGGIGLSVFAAFISSAKAMRMAEQESRMQASQRQGAQAGESLEAHHAAYMNSNPVPPEMKRIAQQLEAQIDAEFEAKLAAQQQTQPVAQNPQYTERDAQEAFDRYWNTVTWDHPQSEIAQNLELMVQIYNNAPPLAARKTLEKLRQINYDLIETAGWNCYCGRRNRMGRDCNCGVRAFMYPF